MHYEYRELQGPEKTSQMMGKPKLQESKSGVLLYAEVKYLYIDYVTDRPWDFKIICKTENYGKTKYIVLRFRRYYLQGFYFHCDGRDKK
jgi:hypothetical protein